MRNYKGYFLLLLVVIMFFTSVDAFGQTTEKRRMKLDEIFILADSCSRQIKVSEANTAKAKESIRVTRNALLPDVKFEATATYNGDVWVSDRNFQNGQTFSSPHFGNSFALEVAQSIYAGGAIINTIKGSKLEYAIAGLQAKGERQKVRFLLTGYYLDLFKSLNQLNVYEKNIVQTQEVISVMKAKVASGIALENDVTRYEVLLQNLLYKKTELQGRITIFNSELVVALGLPEGTEILPDSNLLSWESKRYAEGELQRVAIQNTPTLEQSQLAIKLSENRQKIAQAGYMPNISLVAANKLSGPITYEIPTLNNNINVWYVGLKLSYNIGNLYKTPKLIAREKRSVQQAEQQYALAQDMVKMNVKEAYTDYENSFVLHHTQQKSVQLATENRDMVFKQYMNGLALVIDLLDADDVKLSAEIQETNARINIIYNFYKLQYVTGTL